MKKQKQEIVLSPAQQRVFDSLRNGNEIGDVLLLKARTGSGRSTILGKLQKAIGGALLGIREFMKEETFLQMVDHALAHHQVVIVDDLHLVTRGCDYPLLLDAALTAIMGDAAGQRKKLVFGSDDGAPWPVTRRAFTWKVHEFEPEDYACICRNLLGEEAAGKLDFVRIHRYAPALTAEQLCHTCAWLRQTQTAGTDQVIEYLRSGETDDRSSSVVAF